MKRALHILFVAAALHSARAATPLVGSVQMRPANSRLPYVGLPVLGLGADEGAALHFDLLEDDRRYLRYSLQHCNADWTPSVLAPLEYVDGFNEGVVDNYAFSEATTVHYVHYTLPVGVGEMRPLVSGNYILRVYDETDGPEHPLVEARFAVTEQSAALRGAVTSRTDVDYNRAHQQLSVEADVSQAPVDDAFAELTLVVEQNGRRDNRAVLTRPLRVSGKTAVYEHQPQLIFKGGNEYRRFEAVSTQYPGAGVDRTEFVSPYYHTILEADASRAAQSYQYDRTLSGAYVVREYNAEGDDSDTRADYTVTHFTLSYPETPGLDFYVDADFTGRLLDDNARMQYNPETQSYQRAFMLKQGAYSYQYLAVPSHAVAAGRTDVVEGDHHETSNRYTLLLYSRRPAERWQRLIGAYTLQ